MSSALESIVDVLNAEVKKTVTYQVISVLARSKMAMQAPSLQPKAFPQIKLCSQSTKITVHSYKPLMHLFIVLNRLLFLITHLNAQ